MMLSIYLIGAFASSGIWLSAFFKDQTTSKSDVASWVLVVIATLIWPVSVPLSLKERYSKSAVMLSIEPTLDIAAETR